MHNSKKLLLANKAWAQSKLVLDPSYFSDLAKDQKPEFLWIGCSDSRVPTSEITGTDPGELFVHRNIANVVSVNDPSLLAVVQYAVEALKVKNIIVCGHYNCGGVKASFDPPPLAHVGKWIGGIGDVLNANRAEVMKFEKFDDQVSRLVELNVMNSLDQMAQIPSVIEARKNGGVPHLHGWVYDLKTGLLKVLKTVE